MRLISLTSLQKSVNCRFIVRTGTVGYDAEPRGFEASMAASPMLSVRTLHRKSHARAAFEYSWPNPSAVCTEALINSSRVKLNPNTELLRIVTQESQTKW